MILGIIIAIILIVFALLTRTGLDENLWYEANMFVDADGQLIIIDTI